MLQKLLTAATRAGDFFLPRFLRFELWQYVFSQWVCTGQLKIWKPRLSWPMWCHNNDIWILRKGTGTGRVRMDNRLFSSMTLSQHLPLLLLGPQLGKHFSTFYGLSQFKAIVWITVWLRFSFYLVHDRLYATKFCCRGHIYLNAILVCIWKQSNIVSQQIWYRYSGNEWVPQWSAASLVTYCMLLTDSIGLELLPWSISRQTVYPNLHRILFVFYMKDVHTISEASLNRLMVGLMGPQVNLSLW